MKLLGFATGAVIASGLVIAFNSWRHVSDEDRLFAALTDECAPFILNGDIPFDGNSRPIGVFDNVDIPRGFSQSQSALVFEGRFLVSWGDVEGTDLRACRVAGRQDGDTLPVFAVDPDGFIDRATDAVSVLGDLKPTVEEWTGTEDIPALGWLALDGDFANEPQISLAVSDAFVTRLLVTQRRAD